MRTHARLATLILAACGSDGSDSASGTGTGATQTTETYASDWSGVDAFVRDHCVVCHSATGSASSLPLPEVLQQDLFFADGALVVAGDPDASKFWRVISGEMIGDEVVMPRGTGPLPAETTAHVRTWILDGAPYELEPTDFDGDGSDHTVDCDERDPRVNPEADEVCGDGLDNDCSGDADGPDAVDAGTYYLDNDADSFGDDDMSTTACEAPTGYVSLGGDCDDGDPAYNPNADEQDCTDPNDYNCDGSSGFADVDLDGLAACEDCDDGDASVGAKQTFWVDDDGDGHGDAALPVEACVLALGYADSDDDCDDGSSDRFPGNPEVCDTIDNDCNTLADDNPVDGTPYYPDLDGDSYGDASASPVPSCEPVAGLVENNLDCDDDNGAANPDGTEIPGNTSDDDCDGFTDETIDYQRDIQPIFDSRCADCHSGTAPYEGLTLAPDAYPYIVDQPSSQSPLDFIEPFDVNASYLLHKVKGTQASVGGSGERMPDAAYPLPPLPQAMIDALDLWVAEGAPP